MWRRVDLVWTDISEERIASIFRVEKSASEDPAWAGVSKLQPPDHAGSPLADFYTLKMEAIRSSETSVHTRSTRRHIPEDGILHSHRGENLNLTKKIMMKQVYSEKYLPVIQLSLITKHENPDLLSRPRRKPNNIT
jgi:hypothetical protein